MQPVNTSLESMTAADRPTGSLTMQPLDPVRATSWSALRLEAQLRHLLARLASPRRLGRARSPVSDGLVLHRARDRSPWLTHVVGRCVIGANGLAGRKMCRHGGSVRVHPAGAAVPCVVASARATGDDAG